MDRPIRTLLVAALLGALGVVVIGLLTFGSDAFAARDLAASGGFAQLSRGRAYEQLNDIAHLANPAPYAFFGIVLIATAWGRGRPRVALAIFSLLILTGATTSLLKQLTAAPRATSGVFLNLSPASWPSGHATASMTLALCAVLAVPGRVRPTAAAVGALYTLGVSFSVVALGHHLPSDVLGGYLVAGTWTLLALAALTVADRRRPARVPADGPPPRTGATLAGPSFIAGGALTAAVFVVAARPHGAAALALDHTTAVAVGVVIAALAALLPALLVRDARV